MQNVANAVDGAEAGGKESLKQRALVELKKYAIITAYLWLLFVLFGLYRRQLLREEGISVWQESFAIVNALIFGKVILLGQALEIGRRLERHSLGWVVLGKSLAFTLLLIAFHIVEGAVKAWFLGGKLLSGVDEAGGWSAMAIYACIIFVALVPFFAFGEASRILGGQALWRLFFSGGAKSFRLIAD